MMFQPSIGHDTEIRRFIAARGSNRFHHAWLLEGPKGIGKNLTAINLAATLLGADYTFEASGFRALPGSITEHLVAGSHPDFRLIQKGADDNGKPKQDIPVESLRKLSQFFSLKPAMGGYRVAIIDALDELNASGSNALLKTLEEPPENSVLILIYHGRSGLLPTIRSRCQRLIFKRLPSDKMSLVLGGHIEDESLQKALVPIAAGSPGNALAYAAAEPAELLSALQEFTQNQWPRANSYQYNRLMRLTAGSETHFEILQTFLEHWFNTEFVPQTDILSARKIAFSWQEMLVLAGKGASLKLDLTERVAQYLNHLQSLARSLDTTHAV